MKQATTKSKSASASSRRRSNTRNNTTNITKSNNEMISSNSVLNQSGTSGNFVQRIRTPHTHDVLSGRGGGINSHQGNRRFREWVLRRKEDYNLAGSKAEKAQVANHVIDLVRSQNPPGRFLQRDQAMSTSSSSWWVEVDQTRALAKTSQALREGAPQIRTAHKSELEERAHLKQKRRSHHSITESSSIISNKRRKSETDQTTTTSATATAPSTTIATSVPRPAVPVINHNANNVQALETLQQNVLAAKLFADAQQQEEQQQEEEDEQQQHAPNNVQALDSLQKNVLAAKALKDAQQQQQDQQEDDQQQRKALESLQTNVLAAKALKDAQQQQQDQQEDDQQQGKPVLPSIFIAPPLMSNKDFEERYYFSSSSISPITALPPSQTMNRTMDHTETPPLTSTVTPGENMILPPPLNLNLANNSKNNSKTTTSGNGSGGNLSRSHSLAFSDISGSGYMFAAANDDDIIEDFVNPFADESDIVNYMDFSSQHYHPQNTNGSDFGEGMKTVFDAVHPGVTSPDNGKDDWIPTLLMPWRGSGSLLPRRSNSLSPRTSNKPAPRRGSASGRQ